MASDYSYDPQVGSDCSAEYGSESSAGTLRGDEDSGSGQNKRQGHNARSEYRDVQNYSRDRYLESFDRCEALRATGRASHNTTANTEASDEDAQSVYQVGGDTSLWTDYGYRSGVGRSTTKAEGEEPQSSANGDNGQKRKTNGDKGRNGEKSNKEPRDAEDKKHRRSNKSG